jgi:hypothetical protein
VHLVGCFPSCITMNGFMNVKAIYQSQNPIFPINDRVNNMLGLPSEAPTVLWSYRDFTVFPLQEVWAWLTGECTKMASLTRSLLCWIIIHTRDITSKHHCLSRPIPPSILHLLTQGRRAIFLSWQLLNLWQNFPPFRHPKFITVFTTASNFPPILLFTISVGNLTSYPSTCTLVLSAPQHAL